MNDGPSLPSSLPFPSYSASPSIGSHAKTTTPADPPTILLPASSPGAATLVMLPHADLSRQIARPLQQPRVLGPGAAGLSA